MKTVVYSKFIYICIIVMSLITVDLAFAKASDEQVISQSGGDLDSNLNSELASELEQIKSEILKLNRELFILEEDLLFPASTQVAIFVSVDVGKFFTLDSVELKINDKDVVGFLYTQQQRKALEQGGIQRLYLGNIKVGTHQLTAIFTGVDGEGRATKRAISHQFEKDDETVMIELKIEDHSANYRAEVVVEEWIL